MPYIRPPGLAARTRLLIAFPQEDHGKNDESKDAHNYQE